MDLTHEGLSDILVLKAAEKKSFFFTDEFLKSISVQNDTTPTKCTQETCFRDNEFTSTLSLTFVDSKSGFNYVFLYRYISQINFYFPMRI